MCGIKVSVIIPVYNVEKYVAECLASVLGQTLSDIEIICVDDRGTDGSMRIVERFAERDPRVKIIRHEKNKGQGPARNTGLAAAKGECIVYVDSDDWVMPEMLEKAHAALTRHRLNWVWYKYVCFLEEENVYALEEMHTAFDKKNAGLVEVTLENVDCYPVMACNKMYRTAFLRENNLTWSGGIIYEDVEFYYKAALLSPLTYVLDERFYVYRIRRGSTMNLAHTKDLRCEDLFTALGNFQQFMSERGLFEKGRDGFLDLLEAKACGYLYLQDYKIRTMNAVRQLLVKIGFPDSCRHHRCFDFFQTIYISTETECRSFLYRPLKLFAALSPNRKLRRKWSERVRTLYQVRGESPSIKYVRITERAPRGEGLTDVGKK